MHVQKGGREARAIRDITWKFQDFLDCLFSPFKKKFYLQWVFRPCLQRGLLFSDVKSPLYFVFVLFAVLGFKLRA
jgi:hypothetical protein